MASQSSNGLNMANDEAVSTSLVIINGFLVFFMQVGFLALETGSGRAKNVRNILLKNLLDVMLAAMVWWAVGFAFAYGKSAGGVIGTSQFFYEGENLHDKAIRPWFFSWTFCIAACTIISGCLAERTALVAYPAATLVIAAVVHPLLVHWIWNPQGYLSKLHQCNVLDFAGGMVVHMLGGIFGLVGAYMCGPRLGRFDLLAQEEEEEEQEFTDSLATLSCGGTDGRGSGGDLVDSASELAGSSSPPSDRQLLAGAAALGVGGGRGGVGADLQQLPPGVQQQQQQLLEGGSSSRQLLQPPVPAEVFASSSRGVALEMSQLAHAAPGTGKQVHAGDASAVSVAADGSAAAAQQQLQEAAAGCSTAAQPPTQQPGAAGSSGKWTAFLTQLGLQREQQRRRQRRRRRHIGHHDTSAGSCGSGICNSAGWCKFVPKAMPGHDMAFVTLGTFMLWFGWFGFNNGSVYMYVNGNPAPSPGSLAGAISAEVVQRTSMNTALGGAAAGLTSLLCAALLWGTYDLRICCNGVLSGLVIVTCMCGFVDPWAAVVCSAIAGAVYAGASWLLLRCGIDDPLDSSAVHLGSGILGSIMVAFVANPKHVYALTGAPCGGVFYGHMGWIQLGLQLLGILIVVVFAGSSAWVLFWVLNKKGMLRVDQTTELAGIDNMEHGGPAYPEFPGSWSGGPTAAAPAAAAGGRRILS